MIRGRTFKIPRGERVDLVEGTGSSGVAVPVLRNAGKYPVWIGKVGDGYRLDPGESLPGGLSLGSADKLRIVVDLPDRAPKDAEGEVHALVGYEAIFDPEDQDS